MEAIRTPAGARFDLPAKAVVINAVSVSVSDEAVLLEARRWTNGARGELVTDSGALANSDLSNFVISGLRLGALALAATGNAQDAVGLEQLVKDVGDRTADATTRAAEITAKAVKDAAATVTGASDAAKKAILDAQAQSRTQFAAGIRDAKSELHVEIQRLLGGENPEVLDRLRPLLDRFGTDLDTKVRRQTAELLEKVAKQFDPTDPASPMAKHAARLAEEQERMAQVLAVNHVQLAGKLDELATVIKVQAAAQQAKGNLAQVTPIKGATYAAGIHLLFEGIAVGLGDEYADTGHVVGQLSRCMKGDGVLTVDGGVARVVVEASDSGRTGWNEYLGVAERNRAAVASLGLVRTQDQNVGQSIRVLGSRRIVMAFDPDVDDPNLLRTVVMILRTAALAASGRSGADEIATAEEKLTEALDHLQKLDSIKKVADGIGKGAAKIDRECEAMNTAIRRLLGQALAALAGSEAAVQASDPVGTRHGAA